MPGWECRHKTFPYSLSLEGVQGAAPPCRGVGCPHNIFPHFLSGVSRLAAVTISRKLRGYKESMKVRIDRPACIGAANCVAVAPHLFQLDRDNKAVVNQAAAETDEEILWEAADGCPALAIILEDDDGHQVYPQ